MGQIFTPTALVCSSNPLATLFFVSALWVSGRLELPCACLGVSAAQSILTVGRTAIPLDYDGCRLVLPTSETAISLGPQPASPAPSPSFPMPPDPLLAHIIRHFHFLGDDGRCRHDLEQILDARSGGHWTPRARTGRPERILDTPSGGQWTPGEKTGRPEQILDTRSKY